MGHVTLSNIYLLPSFVLYVAVISSGALPSDSLHVAPTVTLYYMCTVHHFQSLHVRHYHFGKFYAFIHSLPSLLQSSVDSFHPLGSSMGRPGREMDM
jgi:hypothetical protein